VPERARRRSFTAKYKLEVLAAYDAAPGGEKGVILHREGLYSEQEKRQLEQDLAKARFVVDVQAKLHALLETISESADTEPKSTP